MKKFALIMPLFLLFTVFASGANESWVSFGGEYSRATENSSAYGVDFKTKLNSVGIYYKVYEFDTDQTRGYFIHDSFLLPTGGSIEAYGSSMDYTYSDADFRSHLGVMFGPAFRKESSKNTDFYFGVGPSIHMLTVADSSDSVMGWMFGLGLDAGIKFSTSDKRFMKLGVLADYSFSNYVTLNGDGEWASDYSMTSVRPYIGFGFISMKN
jgi:hypothetical protein